METTKTRINHAMESQLELARLQNKIQSLDMDQSLLTAAHYFVSAALIVVAVIFLWL